MSLAINTPHDDPTHNRKLPVLGTHLLDETSIRGRVRALVAQKIERLLEAPAMSEHQVCGHTCYASTCTLQRMHQNTLGLFRSFVNETCNLRKIPRLQKTYVHVVY